MKILYVTTISNTVSAFLIPHIKMLIEDGNQVDVACSIEQESASVLKQNDCKIHNIDFNRSPLSSNNIKAYKQLKELIIEGQYDLVHTHTPVASVITRLVCRNLKDIRVFYTAHGFHFFKNASYKVWLSFYPIEKWLSKYTDTLITINKEDYKTAQEKNFKMKQIKHVHGVGVNLNQIEKQTVSQKQHYRVKYSYSESSFIIFYAAELNNNKHQDLLIHAIDKVKDTIPNIKVIFAGKGPLEKEYKNEVNALGLDQYVDFLGYCDKVNDFLVLSDLVVATSRREGLPVNILEALAVGLPIIATDIRGHNELVKNNENGFLIDTDDVHGLADLIIAMYKDKKKSNQFSKKSQEIVKRYSLVNVLTELREAYRS
ncbi:glycosyltransferase family 4 protein [Tetragenococcus halophilus]|uniref:glycosyltransferase family 4 protein n=1 Tax=Tetragenococcus halophilus TaxID=51669 RepID=UPI0030EB058D